MKFEARYLRLVLAGVVVGVLSGCAMQYTGSFYANPQKYVAHVVERERQRIYGIFKKSIDMVVSHKTSFVVSETLTDGKILDNKRDSKFGTGFVVGDKYIISLHVSKPAQEDTDYASKHKIGNYRILSQVTSIDGIAINLLKKDESADFAVFQLPKELCRAYCNEGVDVSLDLKEGQKVFWVGNPEVYGKKLEFGKIDSLSGNIEIKGKIWKAFEVNLPFKDGDSGTPVFDMYGRLIGMAIARKNGRGVVVPASEFLEHLAVSNEGNRIIAEKRGQPDMAEVGKSLEEMIGEGAPTRK